MDSTVVASDLIIPIRHHICQAQTKMEEANVTLLLWTLLCHGRPRRTLTIGHCKNLGKRLRPVARRWTSSRLRSRAGFALPLCSLPHHHHRRLPHLHRRHHRRLCCRRRRRRRRRLLRLLPAPRIPASVSHHHAGADPTRGSSRGGVIARAEGMHFGPLPIPRIHPRIPSMLFFA